MDSSSIGRKLERSASGLRMVPVSETYACPFALAEPMWVSDKECTKCLSCQKGFDFFNRKHHCRRCGKCFCDRCCHHILPLKRMYFVDPVRHCYDCAVISKEESDFFDKCLQILTRGCDFQVLDLINDVNFGKMKCKLSEDNRQLDHVQGHPSSTTNANTPHAVSLMKITRASFLTCDAKDGTKQVTGITVTFKDVEDSVILHEQRYESVDTKAARSWLASLQKGLKMLFEARDIYTAIT